MEKNWPPCSTEKCNQSRRFFFPHLINKLNLKIGVEVGVLYGDFSFYLAKNLEKIYLVDSWDKDANLTAKQQIDKVIKRMNQFNNWEIIHKSSKEASKTFEDNSLDFVYIDASHDYQSVFDDITFWMPKIKKDGILAGHDYNLLSVKSAVDNFSTSVNALLGDKSESWWFFVNEKINYIKYYL